MDISSSLPRARFGFEFVVLARRWRRELDSRLAAVGLTDATWSPLIHLQEAGEAINQKDLAALVGIDASSLVRLIDLLEGQGLVERRAHASDRRAKLLVLTVAGRAAVAEIRRVLSRAEVEMLGGLSDAELAAMLQSFAKIDRRLRQLHDERELAS